MTKNLFGTFGLEIDIFMNLKILSALSLLLSIVGCTTKPHIELNISNTPEQNVILEHYYKDSFKVIDEKHVSRDKYSLSYELSAPAILRVRYELGKYIFVSVDGDKKIKVNGDWDNFDSLHYIGSKSTDDLQVFVSKMSKFATEQNTYQIVLANLKGQPAKDSLYKDALKKSKNARIDFDIWMEQYINNSPYMLNKLFVMRMLNRTTKQHFIDSTLQVLLAEYPNDDELHYTAQRISDIDSSYTEPSADMAPEIASTTPEGKQLKLSDLRGKYVLVDFWASWCPPCRSANPSLVKFYNKHKSENFTILGVSLDQNRAKWVQAIEDDKLDWHHVSDLKGWQAICVRDYDFNTIPYNVLVDPSGKIVARNLSLKQLDVKLAQWLP